MCNDLRRHRSVRGFSMLELMIVLVLMVGLLAIAWPNMQRMLRRTTLNEAAQVLREAIDEGRYEAITTGKPIFVQMQQGNHEVRTGSFANFANDDDTDKSIGVDANQGALVSDPTATLQQGFGVRGSLDEKPPRTWRLPESIVITEVTWTSDSITDESDANAFASNADSALSDAKNLTDDPDNSIGNGTTDPEIAIADHGTLHNDWWLPISATGLSRNASIVLYDTSIHEKMTVTYASATGALEIVR